MNVLVVLARVPVPGSGKSRLRSVLGDTAVDLLTHALVADVLGWSSPSVDTLLVAHEGPAELLPDVAPAPRLVAQVEGNLGARIDAAVAAGFAQGAARVVIVGTDCPTLPAALIDAAFAGLSRSPSTLIPALDGGWIALGVDRPLDGALDAVSWSNALTGQQTIDALREHGRPPLLLPPWHDIDEPGDIQRLHWDRARLARAPRTAAVLAAFATPVS